jgi:hypothetical protein
MRNTMASKKEKELREHIRAEIARRTPPTKMPRIS